MSAHDGLPPLRDSSGECLWYAVSGRAKNDNKADVYNWDTPGQFIVQTPSGQVLAGATPHARPLAVIFSAGRPINGQNRNAGSRRLCRRAALGYGGAPTPWPGTGRSGC